MIGLALAGLLLGAPAGAEPEALHVDFPIADEQAQELDGRWVEFQAYVMSMGISGKGHPYVLAMPDWIATYTDGTTQIRCGGPEGTDRPMLMRGGLGRLRARDIAVSRTTYPRVRIRAVYHNSEMEAYAGPQMAWPGYFDHAEIVAVTGEQCDLYPSTPATT